MTKFLHRIYIGLSAIILLILTVMLGVILIPLGIIVGAFFGKVVASYLLLGLFKEFFGEIRGRIIRHYKSTKNNKEEDNEEKT